MQNDLTSYPRWLYAILFYGIIARLVPYLHNRSLWLDEANLANAIIESSFNQLMGVLPYAQAAPIGFLWLEKISFYIFGSSEFSLRLIPLLTSIASLFLFYAFAKKIFQNNFIGFALAFFAFCPSLVYYASEVKQYGFDVFTTLIMMNLSWPLLEAQPSKKSIFLVTIIGAILIWFSQPIIFILAGIGLTIFVQQIKQNRLHWPILFTMAVSWFISFGIYFFGFLKLTIYADHLHNFHKDYFMPITFWKIESWKWYFNTGVGLFENPGGILFKYIAAPIALIGILFGFKKQKTILLFLLLPTVLTLIASGLHLYSTLYRLILFLVPVLLIFVAKGLEVLYFQIQDFPQGKTIKHGVFGIGFLILLQPFLNTGIHYMLGIKVEEIKIPLSVIQEQHQANDLFFVYKLALPAFRYYQDQWDLEKVEPIQLELPTKNWQPMFSQLKKGQRFWLIFTHHDRPAGLSDDQIYRQYIDQYATPIHQQKAKGAACFLYKWGSE